jgi:hypothetical protein
MAQEKFRRLFIDHGHVCAELALGELWWLPPKGNTRYDASNLFNRVRAAGVIETDNWKRFGEET